MAIDVHVVELVPNTQTVQSDRVMIGLQTSVPNVAGSGAGAVVVTPVSFAAGALPGAYAVVVTPGQDATAFITNKTTTGFNVALAPRLASMTLAAGTFDVAVFA